ncbi:MAG: hypothetical protein HYU56_01735 [Candidatus Aenigmarchaeota archaeon]|nr:hypothetical protein [Candidatus Aenigmarchaeota archaeon]
MKRKHKSNHQLKTRSALIGSLAALAIFSAFGIITALVPNELFIRMTPVYFYDYIFLILTSVLSGAYIGLWYYAKKTRTSCNYAATGGAVGGFFSFGCAICNKLLILLLGLSGVAAYFMPIQPVLGAISIALLTYAVYMQSKAVWRVR